MARLYLLKGAPDAAGWWPLQRDAKDGKTLVICFDRDRWALVEADTPPEGYEEMESSDPADGLYLDQHGRPIYVLNNKEVDSAMVVIEAVGDKAKALLEKIGDPDLVLERLGMSY